MPRATIVVLGCGLLFCAVQARGQAAWNNEIHCDGTGDHGSQGDPPDEGTAGGGRQCHGEPGDDGSCGNSFSNSGSTGSFAVSCWQIVRPNGTLGSNGCNATLICPGGSTQSCGGPQNRVAVGYTGSASAGVGFIRCEGPSGVAAGGC